MPILCSVCGQATVNDNGICNGCFALQPIRCIYCSTTLAPDREPFKSCKACGSKALRQLSKDIPSVFQAQRSTTDERLIDRSTPDRPRKGLGSTPAAITVRHRGEIMHVPPSGRSTSVRLVDLSSVLGKGRSGTLRVPEFVMCKRCNRPLWGVRSMLIGLGPQCMVLNALESNEESDIEIREVGR